MTVRLSPKFVPMVSILVALSSCWTTPSIHAQAASAVSAGPPPGGPVQPGLDPGSTLPDLGGTRDPSRDHMLREMMKQRNTQRQKQIVEDTDHLLDLAKQLKDAVDKSNKNELSLSVVDTAAEIEKLAKTVKEKMRDGD